MVDIILVYLTTVILTTLCSGFIPRAVPETVQFGVRVPPKFVRADSVLRTWRRYYIRWWTILGLTLVVSVVILTLGQVVWAQPATLLGLLAASLIVNFLNYYTAHRTLLRRKVVENWYANHTESVVADTRAHVARHSASILWALPTVIICLVAFALGASRFAAMPQQIAIHFDFAGQPNGWAEKSVWSVFGPFLMEVALAVILVIVQFTMHRFPVRLDPVNPDASRRRIAALQSAGIRSIWVLFAFVNLGLLVGFLPVWGVVQGSMVKLEPVTMGLILIGVAITIWIMYRAAQSHRIVASGAVNSDRVHRDDDRFWIGGVIYWNRNDPAFTVPKRFGIGVTLNFAHPLAWLSLALIIAIPIVISILAAATK